VTFNQDVAPILFEHCASCHRPIESAGSAKGRVNASGDPLCIAGAPFPLLDFGDARTHARQVVAATRRRTMPPWPPEPGYGEFDHPRRLTDQQIATIQRWVEQGALEGSPANKPAPPAWADGWQLGKPDLVLTMPPYSLRGGGGDVFRNFVLPVPVSATRYVRAMEFRTDNPTILHHASVGVDRARFSRTLDRADSEPGFASMPDDQVQNVFGWSPGKAPFMAPADMAWTLDKGSDLVLQLHMLPGPAADVIQPTVGLFFTDTPPTRVPLVVRLESKSIDIRAGESDYAIEDRYILPADVDVVSVYPHAHYLARDVKGTATLPDGTTKWLIWIKNWDFRWQDQYRYATPLSLPKGTTLSLRLTYDNSDGNPRNPNRPVRRVKWGPQSSDEMGALWLEVLPRRADDAALLRRDYAIRALRTDLAGAEVQVKASPNDPLARNFLATKYLQAGRIPDAVVQLDAALGLNQNDAEAHSNLGSALLQQGQLVRAEEHLRHAVALKPGDDRMHFNLANGLTAVGRPADAIQEFKRAVQLNPDNADAHFNLAMLVGPRGNIDEAIAHLRRAVEINPQYGDAHRNLGVALGLQGKIAEAIEEDRLALQILPESAATRQHLEQLLAAQRSR
jgi:tetratricopeptide (TPR) repeat protein